jgi:hypothetical protein
MNVNQNQNLIITRDGQIDKSYYAAIRSEQRKRHLKAVSKEVAVFTARTPIYALKASAWLFNNALEQTNEYNRH